MIEKGTIRRYVREAIAAGRGYGLTEQMVGDAVNARVPGDVDLTTLRQAIEWNHAKAYIAQRTNEDTDATEWVITKAGLAKEEIK